MTSSRDPYYTTAFGAVLDQEIADALRAGMALEAVYVELAARTRAVADQVRAKHEQKNFCIDTLLDNGTVVELIEEIQDAGGPTHADLCCQLRKLIDYPPGHPEYELGLTRAHEIVGRQAERRARRQYLQRG